MLNLFKEKIKKELRDSLEEEPFSIWGYVFLVIIIIVCILGLIIGTR